MPENNELLDLILHNNPSVSTLRVVLARMMEEGKFNQVIQEGIEALRSNSDDIYLMKILAEAYMKVGFVSQAEKLLQKASSQLGALSVMLKDLSRLYASQKRYEEAAVLLNRYLSFHPEDREALDLLEEIKTPVQGVPLEEIHEFEESEGPEAGEELGEAEEPEESEEPSETAFEEEPLAFRELATPTLAEIYFNQGQINDAIQIYEKVVARHPDDHEASRRLAELKAMAYTPDKEVPQQVSIAGEKEKMIGVLENWLARIQEMGRVS